MVASFTRIVLVVYFLQLLMFAWFQSQLIFPGQASRGHAGSILQPSAGTELIRLTTRDGVPIVALFGAGLGLDGQPLPDASRRPTLLYFYGNGSNVRSSVDLFESFRRLGINVMIPEYVGYGMSEGTVSESACYATADAAYEHLTGRSDVDPRRIVAGGWSLGGAVAIDLAARQPVAALVTFSTFTGISDLAGMHYPWLPSRWLLRHRFESELKMDRVPVPALLVHGDRDELIPLSMSDRLARAARGPATRLDVRGAGHNDIFEVGGRDLFEAVGEFLDTL